MSWGYIGGAAIGVAGSFFANQDEATSSPEVPQWLKDDQQDLTRRLDELMDRPSISPEDRVQELDPSQLMGIEDLEAYGAPGGTGARILDETMVGAGGVSSGMEGLMGTLEGDAPTNEGIDMEYVMSLINNDVLGEQIQASTRDVERRFSEVDAPQSRLMQALSGGTGSTRGAIGDAILQRGAEDRAGDIAGTMRGRAFQQALGLGGQRAAQTADLAGQARGQDIMGYGGMFSTGLESSQLANKIGLGNIDALMSAGGMRRSYEQALNDVEYQNWQRMYGDVDMASGIYSELGAQYTGVSASRSSSLNPFSAALEGASTFGPALGDFFDRNQGSAPPEINPTVTVG